MSYAVIQTGGKQYKVSAGEIIKVEKLPDSNPDTKVEFVPEREGELGYRYVSSDKIKDMLGWSPSTTFESGVKKTIDWYQTK